MRQQYTRAELESITRETPVYLEGAGIAQIQWGGWEIAEGVKDGYLYCKHIKPFAMDLYDKYWTAWDGPPDGGHLMDSEKLIERLSKYSEPVIAYKLDADFAASITDAISELRGKCDGCSVPATTAEMIRDLNDAPKLRAENEKLREKIEDARLKGYAKGLSEMSEENEELRAELEQVKQELDAAVSWAQKYTESIDRPCVACKHNTGDYVCTAICGNCGPMGTESCKWEFDFSGELKED